MAPLEAESAELVHRVRRRDDRQFLVQLLGGDVIEMIAVVVRQDDQIYRWQVAYLARRLDLAPGPYAMTQIDVLAFVQEGRIGQDGQSAETDQCGGVTDEVKIALTEFCRPTAGQLQGSHRVLSFGW